jgi:hypothetical protein
MFCIFTLVVPGVGAGIAQSARYGLDGPGIESRVGRDFFAHVQTGPGAHPVSCTVGSGSFPGVNRLLALRSRMSRTIPLLPLWAFGACYRANFTFTFTSWNMYAGLYMALLLLLLLLLLYFFVISSFCVLV